MVIERELTMTLEGGDSPLTDTHKVTAKYSSGALAVEVPGKTIDSDSGEIALGVVELAVDSGPPTALYARVSGPLTVEPLGTLMPGHPFVYIEPWKRNPKWPGGIRRLRLINVTDEPVTFQGEILWNVRPEDVPNRLKPGGGRGSMPGGPGSMPGGRRSMPNFVG
jgi:hypothetical protein